MVQQAVFADTWALVEIMGHQRFAGRLTEEVIAGVGMLRLDVPECGDLSGFSRYFSPGSVYAITPTTEELARQIASGLKRQPISLYELPEEMREKLRRPLTAIEDSRDEDEDY